MYNICCINYSLIKMHNEFKDYYLYPPKKLSKKKAKEQLYPDYFDNEI